MKNLSDFRAPQNLEYALAIESLQLCIKSIQINVINCQTEASPII